MDFTIITSHPMNDIIIFQDWNMSIYDDDVMDIDIYYLDHLFQIHQNNLKVHSAVVFQRYHTNVELTVVTKYTGIIHWKDNMSINI